MMSSFSTPNSSGSCDSATFDFLKERGGCEWFLMQADSKNVWLLSLFLLGFSDRLFSVGGLISCVSVDEVSLVVLYV